MKEHEELMPVIARPCRILVVEDDESVREVTVQMLQILDCEVERPLIPMRRLRSSSSKSLPSISCSPM